MELTLTAVAPLFAAAALLLATAAHAADEIVPELATQTEVDLIIELGLGGRIQPEYEGSDGYEVAAFPIIGLGYLNIPGLFAIGSTDPQVGGLSFGPSFNYVSNREFGSDSELAGLNEVDGTFEAGLRASFEWTNAQIWGEARYAFGGVDGFVAEFGVDAVARPTELLELKLGPFATLASADYMRGYFGVTDQESANTGFRVSSYTPDGGFKSVGLRAVAKYEFKPTWYLNADASYSKLVGDAGDSPIVLAGDDDQFTFGLGLSKKFTLNLF